MENNSLNKNDVLNIQEIRIDVDGELEELLQDMEDLIGSFNDDCMDSLFVQCRGVVIDQIIGPFGLSRGMFVDKHGGNVTTLHNFTEGKNEKGERVGGVVATDSDKKSYENWQDSKDNFDRKPYEKGFSGDDGKRKQIFKANETLKDGYTGKEIPKDGRSHLDHVTSASEIDKNPKNHLFMNKEQRVDMAVADENLIMTDSSLNQSKNDKDLKEWMDSPNAKNKEITNAEKYGVDGELAQKKYDESKKHINNTVRKEQIKKQGTELLMSGGKEAAMMGGRMAIGVVLKELTEAIFFELRDLIKNGGKDDLSFIEEFKLRVKRVVKKVQAKWKDALSAFGEGAVSGFFSNLITFVVNSFVTTVKRWVRIIREAFNSIVRAVKIIAFPQDDVSREEAAFEAVKILSVATVACVGLLLEDALANFMKTVPFLVPFAEIVSPILMGIATGIASIMVIHAFDRFKERIELNHKSITLAASGALANQYRTLKTLMMLERSVYFNDQMILAINENLAVGAEMFVEHERHLQDVDTQFNDRLAQFKKLNT